MMTKVFPTSFFPKLYVLSWPGLCVIYKVVTLNNNNNNNRIPGNRVESEPTP